MKVFANDGGNGTKNDWVVGDSEGNTFWFVQCGSVWRVYYLLLYGLMLSGAPNENIVQNHLNIALLNVF